MPVTAQISDECLLERMRAGEPALYEVLIGRHRRRLQSVARRILANDAEAEEAVQDAHLRVLTRLDQFQGRSSFLAYLTRVVVNEALGRIRARPRVPVLDVSCTSAANSDVLFVSPIPDPEEQAIGRELRALLRSAVEELPEMYRAAFRMREIEEMSVAEAAACLGISCGCVKTRLHRAKALLRREFCERTGLGCSRARRTPPRQRGRKRG
jgi:RNA polymerase sigma-70 factor (ECF subfamily)